MFRTSSLRCSANVAAVFCLGAEVVLPIVDSAASGLTIIPTRRRGTVRATDLVLYGTRFDERNQIVMLSTTLHIKSNTAQPD